MRRVFPAVQDAPSVQEIPLVYSDGTGIPVGDITHIYLTLWNAEAAEGAENLINTRDHVEVLGDNNGAVSAEGVLTWAAAAADNAIQDPRKAPGETELHAFELEIHLGSGLPFRLLYGLRVRVMQKRPKDVDPHDQPAIAWSGATVASIALATLDDVLRHTAMQTLAKAGDEGGLSLEQREALEQMILAGSLDLEQSAGRWFRYRDDHSELLDVEEGQRTFYLHAYPVREIVSVTYREDGDFSGSPAAMAATSYALVRGGRLGELMLRPGADYLTPSPASLRVVYKGGLASMVHQVAPNLQQGLVDQIVFCWKRGDNPEITSLSQENGSVTYFRNGSGVPSFAKATSKYRERLW